MFALLFDKKPVQIIGSALLFTVLGSLFPAFAGDASVITIEQVKPLETPRGTVEDLEGLEDRNASEWFWGVGGEYEVEVSTDKFPLESDSVEAREGEKDWPNYNRGDARPIDGVTYPITDF